MRAKIEADPDRPAVLVTVRGRGYQLRTDAPAPAAPAPPALAPIPRLDRLVGREAELRDLAATLHGGARLITLTGPSGVGKTWLARRALSEVADAGRRTAWFADATGATSATGLLAAIAEALRVDVNVDAGADPLVRALGAAGPSVGVIDDAQDLDAHALATLSDLVRAVPGLAVVATSQRLLGLEGEHRLAVEPLPDDDAVALLRERLAALGVPAPPQASLRALVRRVEGLPLAIDLVAPLLDVSTVEALLARDVLAIAAERPDRPARHRTLGAAVAASVAALGPEERDRLVQLSVFAGAFPPAAAETVAGASAEELAALRRRSLLQRLPDGRLAVYGAVRAWAERIAPRAEVVARHARFLLDVAPPDPWAADLRRALAQGPAELRAGIAEVLSGVVHRRGPVASFPELVRAAHTAEVPPRDRVKLRLAASEACRMANRADEAADEAQAAFAGATALGDDELAARALTQLSAAASAHGEMEEAAAHAREALVRAERVDDPRLHYVALSFLGCARSELHDAAGALELHLRAAALAERLGERGSAAIALGNAGNALAMLGRVDEAMTSFERALALADERHPRFSGVVRMNLAHHQAELGRDAEARSSIEHARRLLERAGDEHHLRILELRHALVDALGGRTPRAVRRLEALLAAPEGLHPSHRLRAAAMLAVLTGDPSRLPAEHADDGLVAAAAAVIEGRPIPEGTPPDTVDEVTSYVRARSVTSSQSRPRAGRGDGGTVR